MQRELADKIWTILEPVVQQQGYEIVEVEVHGNRRSVLRVFLDGPSGIGIDKCAEFSRLFSDILDVEDPIKNAYDLEVSSPGLNRPLRKLAHFKKQIGEEVQVRASTPDGLRKFRGKLKEVHDDKIVLGDGRTIPFGDIDAANVIYDFKRAQ